MLYSRVGICGPNHFSLTWEKNKAMECLKESFICCCLSCRWRPEYGRRRPSAVEERRAEVGIRDRHYVRHDGQTAIDQDSAEKQMGKTAHASKKMDYVPCVFSELWLKNIPEFT